MLVSSILALGMTAPLTSLTVPTTSAVVFCASIGALAKITVRPPSRQLRRMERVKQSGLPRNNVPRFPRVEFLEGSFMSGLPCMYELVMSCADASAHNGEEPAYERTPHTS